MWQVWPCRDNMDGIRYVCTVCVCVQDKGIGG